MNDQQRSDAKTVSAWMETKPTAMPEKDWWEPQLSPHGWWRTRRMEFGLDHEWISLLAVCTEVELLGRLHDVESRLTEEQRDRYCRSFCPGMAWDGMTWVKEYWICLHATWEQKLRALAETLSQTAGGKSK